MTMIEGVGDEVLDFFIVVGVLLVGWIAWCSTNIADQPLVRTVLILQRRTRTRFAALRANQVASTEQRIAENSDSDRMQTDSSDTTITEVDNSCPETVPATSEINNSTSAEVSDEATNEEALIQAMDSYVNESSNLLQENKVEEVEKTEVKNKNETECKNETTTSNSESITEESENLESDEERISIKLKFINDTQRLVTGSLKEILGDFKKRHFQAELDSRKLVRLVFNGHVLQPDSVTLEQCGFFHNCVVHCLIHQPRPAPVASNPVDNSSRLYFNPLPFQNIPAGAGLGSVQNEWDLSRLLVTIVTLILGLAWYFRYNYAQLFTVTSTVGLFGLTAIFTVSLFGHLFSEQDNFRNIE